MKILKSGNVSQRNPLTLLIIAFLLIVSSCDIMPENKTSPGGDSFGLDGLTQPLAISGSQWSANGLGTVNLLGDGVTADPSMNYLLDPAGFDNNSWDLSTTANEDGTITLFYEYTGFHAFFQVTVFAEAFVTGTSGTTTVPLISDGPINCCTPPSAGFTYSGQVTLSVQEGDTFGFRFGGSNFDSNNQLSGTFTVDLNKPYSQEECKYGGWENFGFINQGQCVRFYETGKDSRVGSMD